MSLNFKSSLVAICLLIGLTCSVHATRFDQYTKKYKNPPHPTKGVLTASYFGSEGTEWLAGADFLSDGTLIVAGTSLGPSLESLAGTKVKVLGTDTPPLSVSIVLGGKKKKSPSSWQQPEATGFVAAISPDLKKCSWAVRFPWQAGSITDLVVDPTGIYVTGVAGPQLAKLGQGTDVSAEPVTDNGTAYIVKLTKDGSRVLWIRTFTDAGQGPRLRMRKDGTLMVEGGWVYVFQPDGALAKVAKVNKVTKRCRGVDPNTFECAMGWDTNTHTGREPWRQPHLVIAQPPDSDGQSAKKEYYAWSPKLVGSKEGYRLVSDSSFRYLWYDDNGILYAVGWSDGGNTVLERDPMDLHKGVPFKGLGFSTWGATVSSFAHLLKLETGTDNLAVSNKTLWAAYLKGKERPNGANIDNVCLASEGSVLMAGGIAHHLIQTGDAIHWNPDECAGQYVAVLNDDWSSLRFSSIIEATGEIELRANQQWAISSRKVGGRDLAVFVTSGVPTHRKTERTAPQRNPLQSKFAGGETDGYLLVIDLGQ